MYKKMIQKILFVCLFAISFAPVNAQEAELANQAIQTVSQQASNLVETFEKMSAPVKNFILNVLAFRLKPHPSITSLEEGEKVTQNVYGLIEKDAEALEFFRAIFKEIERAANPLMELFNAQFEKEKEANKDEQELYQSFMMYNQKLMELNQICLSLIYEKLYNAANKEDANLLIETITETGDLISGKKSTAQLPSLQDIAQQINDFIASQKEQATKNS